ncbi:hypothetical protein DRO31_08235 [Candidatus Bathyarchaeota archaeon]|nr:MAG: hypothetical protein DRO31_08235 [Candidatus Bathyarchaeota archaeon]
MSQRLTRFLLISIIVTTGLSTVSPVYGQIDYSRSKQRTVDLGWVEWPEGSYTITEKKIDSVWTITEYSERPIQHLTFTANETMEIYKADVEGSVSMTQGRLIYWVNKEINWPSDWKVVPHPLIQF